MALNLNRNLLTISTPPITLPQLASKLTQITGHSVLNLSHPRDRTELILSIAMKHEISDQQQPFYVMDLGELARLLKKWNENLPGVRPFYAVKCNDNPGLLGSLAALGMNFDCASPAEIGKILALGVPGARIVDANACKSESHIRYAKKVGVNLTTFDCVEELNKIKRCHPDCNLLLRLKVTNDESSWRPLGSRFGALPEEMVPLLMHARQMRLNVVGVSFHVGSKATEASVYGEAVAAAKFAFDAAADLGIPKMNILNIGGGFSYNKLFDDISITLKDSIKKHFSGEAALEIMAEPGRFFAETPFTLVTNVIGKRVRGEKIEYTIDDGKYGSMRDPLQDRESTTMKPLLRAPQVDDGSAANYATHLSTIFGPTCDANDIVTENRWLPELHVNDMIVLGNMGSYTSSLGSKFNGFDSFAVPTYFTLTNF